MKQKNLLPNLQQSYWLFFFDNFEKEILRWTVRFLIDLVDCLGSFLTKNGQIAVRRKLIKDDHFIWCTCSLRKLYFQVGFLYNWLFFVNCTVWTLLHNQKNQSLFSNICSQLPLQLCKGIDIVHFYVLLSFAVILYQ